MQYGPNGYKRPKTTHEKLMEIMPIFEASMLIAIIVGVAIYVGYCMMTNPGTESSAAPSEAVETTAMVETEVESLFA